MGRVIDFYSHRVVDKNRNNGFVVYDPEMPIATEIFVGLDKSVLLDGCWVPLSWDEHGIVVLIDDPRDEEKKARIKTELRTKWVIFKAGKKEDIEAFIHRSFNQLEIDDFFMETMSGKKPMDETYLLNTIIADAYLRGVPEVHFDAPTAAGKVRVQFLMAGMLRAYMTLPEEAAGVIFRAIMAMANLDATDDDLPKIGHITFKHDGLPEFRIAVTTEPSDGLREYVILKIPEPRDT